MPHLPKYIIIKVIDRDFPSESISIIAKATAVSTKKELTFQQLNDEINDQFVLSGLAGTYSSTTNRINTCIDSSVISHELGHAMENTLNSISGGLLRQTFKTINGERDYSKYDLWQIKLSDFASEIFFFFRLALYFSIISRSISSAVFFSSSIFR